MTPHSLQDPVSASAHDLVRCGCWRFMEHQNLILVHPQNSSCLRRPRGATARVLAEVQQMRAEEESAVCWFVLPGADEDDVDWFDFFAEIVGPVSDFFVGARFSPHRYAYRYTSKSKTPT